MPKCSWYESSGSVSQLCKSLIHSTMNQQFKKEENKHHDVWLRSLLGEQRGKLELNFSNGGDFM